MSEEMEPILEPDLKIVDAHHHLMDGPGHRYTIDDYAAELRRGARYPRLRLYRGAPALPGRRPRASEAGRRDRVRRFAGGAGRAGRLGRPQALRRHRRLCGPRHRGQGGRGSGRPYRSRRRALQGHSPGRLLGRRRGRLRPYQCAPAAGPAAGCGIRARLPAIARPRPFVRRRALPPAVAGTRGPRAAVPGHADNPQPSRLPPGRRAPRPRPGRGDGAVAARAGRGRRMPECPDEGRRLRHKAVGVRHRRGRAAPVGRPGGPLAAVLRDRAGTLRDRPRHPREQLPPWTGRQRPSRPSGMPSSA